MYVYIVCNLFVVAREVYVHFHKNLNYIYFIFSILYWIDILCSVFFIRKKISNVS